MMILPSFSQSVSNAFWQAQSIYQIITDRFYDGDPSNNNADGNFNATGTTSVHGGDFKGLDQKLDYIKALGATAIWISPIVLNGHGQFHGYAARDFYHVDPHWGSLADLQHFVQTAHAKGLLVIDDIVCNHGDDLIYSADSGYPAFVEPPAGYHLKYSGSITYAPPFDIYNTNYTANNALTNLFHNYGAIPDYNTPEHYQLGELDGLDDFRTESTYVRSNMAAIYQSWIQTVGFDGFRIDTFKHVDTGFWQSWCPALHQFAATNSANPRPNFFMFGEVFDSSESLCGYYTGAKSGGPFLLDSVLDYPLYFTLNSVFISGGATRQIENHYANVATYYDTNAQMRLVTFLDNHDNPRFLNSGTTSQLQVALAFLYTSRGIPSLYYGTEQGFDGATDPNDREDMFAGQFKDAGLAGMDSFNETHPLFQLIAKLNNFRRLYPALTLGAQIAQYSNASGAGLFAYSRRLGAQEVFVVFNTANSTQTLPACALTYAPGTALVNLLDPHEIISVSGSSQTPAISVPPLTAKIFIAQSQTLPLDPVVTTNFPLHSAANVPTWSPIVLQFSKPMNTNSVQSAFSVSPAVSGNFSWSPAKDTMTFTPTGAGLAGSTNIFVRVTNTAVDTVSSQPMFAPYELKFATAATTFHDLTPPTLSLQTPTNGATISGNLNISGTASDDVAVTKVEVQLDNNPWLTANGTTSWNLNLNSSNFLNGPHLISARATDSTGNISVTNTTTVKFFNVPGNYLQRISGGNPANVTDCSGNLWLADPNYSFGAFGYSGGTTGYLANAISGLCADGQSLYQRERYSTSSGGFYYEFDGPEGIYETTLLEAETYWSGSGERIFNVFIQGQPGLTNFDIYAAAGGQNIPLSLVFTNAVTNSRLQILFTPVVDNARISGIQVRKIADVFSDTDGIPDWWRLAYFGHALGSANDDSRGMDDADGDGVSDLTEYLHGTDPLDSASVPVPPHFAITQISLVGDTVKLDCASTTNWTFQLQRSDSLEPENWTNINGSQSGTGLTLLFSDTVGEIMPAEFYRIQAR
ncbi:MAG TPA: alpha-amylase family glycosyl hydrolase [Verrucomicrobiae bacterium]